MQTVLTYIASLIAFAAVDFVWIGVLMKDFYNKNLGSHLAPTFNLYAATAFYLIYTAGVLYFAVFSANTLLEAVTRGAILGFVGYSLYECTNWATLSNWPFSLVVVDIVWGTVLSGMVAGVGFVVLGLISK